VLAPPRANRARLLHAGMLVQADKECSVPWRLCLASGACVDEPWHSFFAPMLLLWLQSWHCMDSSVAGLRELLDTVADENPPDDFRHAFVIGGDSDSGRAVALTLASPPFSSRFTRRVAWLEG
jgi:hypothetical protein